MSKKFDTFLTWRHGEQRVLVYYFDFLEKIKVPSHRDYRQFSLCGNLFTSLSK